jgi:hypothetical protein
MRTLIYKRVHIGDPDPQTGVFGNNDCMRSIRERQFDAVIGIGGIGREPKSYGVDGKLKWIGIGPFPHGRHPKSGSRRLIFRHFKDFEQAGPQLRQNYPALASYMYDTNRRSIMHSPSPAEGRADLDRDVEKILRFAMAAPPSNQPAEPDVQETRGICPPKISCSHRK